MVIIKIWKITTFYNILSTTTCIQYRYAYNTYNAYCQHIWYLCSGCDHTCKTVNTIIVLTCRLA